MKCRLKEMEEATTIRDTQSNVTKEMQGSLPMCLPIFSFLLHESIRRCTEPCRAHVIAGPIAGRQHIQLVVRNNDELTKFLGAITMLPTVC